jgi:exopolysaccharide biosynthesis polyprenyl glycosylphosphotransferase
MRQPLQLLLLVLDLLLINGGFLLSLALRARWGTELHPASAQLATYGDVLLGANPLLLLAFAWGGLYRLSRTADGVHIWAQGAKAVSAVALIGALLLFLAPGYRSGYIYSRLLLLLYVSFLLGTVGTGRVVIRWVCRRIWARRAALRRVLIVGGPEAIGRLAEQIRAEPASGYELAATLALPTTDNEENIRDVMQTFAELTERERPGAAIFIADHRSFRSYTPMVLHSLDRNLEVQVVTSPALFPYIQRRAGAICGEVTVEVTRTPLYALKQALKRASDLLLATVGLCLTAPLLVLVGALLRLEDHGPALVLHRRVGQRGMTFAMVKLRSMRVNASVDAEANIAEGPLTLIPNDPRVTRVGRWLRRHKLDELPQLLNVLLGQMSLVGPRPPTAAEAEQYELWQRGRLFVRPGLTGLWQIDKQRKWRFNEMVELDLQYILNWSLLLDYSIMLRTIPAVLRGT